MLGVREYQAVASVAKMHPLQYRMKVQWKGEKGEVKEGCIKLMRRPGTALLIDAFMWVLLRVLPQACVITLSVSLSILRTKIILRIILRYVS